MRCLNPNTIKSQTSTTVGTSATARLRRIVRRCNTEIVAELRGQYERLAAIDCVREAYGA